MISQPAYAMQVNINGEPCPLNLYETLEEGAQAVSIPVTELEVYGFVQGDKVSIRVGDTIYYVDQSELEEKIPSIDVSIIPNGEGMSDLNAGMNGDSAVILQEQLAQLGYYSGAPDGEYGPGTMDSVSRFQADHRLAQTGNADVNTQLTLQQLLTGVPDTLDVSYPPVYSVEKKFAKILPRTDADLSAFADPKWVLSYDEYENFGTLNPSVKLGSAQEGNTDLDRISLQVTLQVILQENEETGRLELKPAVVVESLGSYRPYLQSVIFNTEEAALTTEGGGSQGEIEGAQLKEFGYAFLTDEMIEALKGNKVTGIRINGKNEHFDMKLSKKVKKNAAKFAKAV